MSQTIIPFPTTRLARPDVVPSAGFWQRVQASFVVMRTQRLLAALDDRTLSDIGVTGAQAQSESARWELDPACYR